VLESHTRRPSWRDLFYGPDHPRWIPVEGQRMISRVARFPGHSLPSLHLVASDPEHSTWLALGTLMVDALKQRSQPSASRLIRRPHSHLYKLPRLLRSR
jgi:hypothetical protein